jgi:hypothetical protein
MPEEARPDAARLPTQLAEAALAPRAWPRQPENGADWAEAKGDGESESADGRAVEQQRENKQAGRSPEAVEGKGRQRW